MTDRPTPNIWNLLAWLMLGLRFAWEMAMSVKAVLSAALGRDLTIRPAVIAVPLELRSDHGITLLAHLISLTPGTTSLHVSEDRRTLFVHALDGQDPTAVADGIKAGFERAIMRVLP